MNIFSSLLAGIMVGIGCISYLFNPNYIGAFLFSLALCTIVKLQLNLYTGKVHNYPFSLNLYKMLFFNLIGVFLIGILAIICNMDLSIVYNTKIERDFYIVLIYSIFCGILMTIAVTLKEPIYLIMCVMSFILMGADHCVANTFYLLPGIITLNIKSFIYLFINIIGNTIGSKIIYFFISHSRSEEQI